MPALQGCFVGLGEDPIYAAVRFLDAGGVEVLVQTCGQPIASATIAHGWLDEAPQSALAVSAVDVLPGGVTALRPGGRVWRSTRPGDHVYVRIDLDNGVHDGFVAALPITADHVGDQDGQYELPDEFASKATPVCKSRR